ncbi:hypothetical protein GGX14DRAFT_496598 [Mycena pura]|uniref:BTB domain-containing protein n=1 Tax=Mycena pura TaxID=153505 RepID=A0AAD6VJP0_9AGAR|nr:hypothetical protein GGX14DRAFT_496598 [Mycena pura]
MTETTRDPPSPFTLCPPFDSTGGDVQLRSSDGVDFHVHRLVLSLASPFFKDMFSLPQPDPGLEVATIQMSETASVLYRALRFWYPGAEPPAIQTLDELREMLEVLILKYDMQFIVPAAKKHLREFLAEDSVAVFAIACRHEWRDVALEAAKSSLRLPIRAFESRPAQLEYMTADTYHSLLHYHTKCAIVATASTSALRWASYADIPGTGCTNWKNPTVCPRARAGHWTFAHNTLGPLTAWFSACLDILAATLLQSPAATLDSPDFLSQAVEKIGACESCRSEGFPALMKFLGILRAQIEHDLDSVELDLQF